MKAISEFVVRVMDLIEAEGALLRTVVRAEARAARRDAAGFAIGVAILSIAVPVCVASVGLFAAAIWSWLEPIAGTSAAAAVMGGGLLVVGAGLLAVFSYQVRRGAP